MPKQLTTKYSPQDIEAKWQKYWQEQKTYEWDSSSTRENTFSIDTPPPTVSGSLHMGHIYSYTQADFIARFQRMNGKSVYYPVGFDDNGLPTERLVEKVKGIKASQLERTEFNRICMEVVEESEQEFEDLFKSIGLSMDWNQKYQTISSSSKRVSQSSFLDLFQKQLVERKHTPTFWDPVDQTAIAQAEIEDKEKDGVMYDIIFSLESGEKIDIATTRPELIPACVAILFNPEDPRYSWMHGLSAITPIFNAKVPLIADSEVDIEKGTGLVMCCTFGDIQDIKWWQRHELPLKQAIDKHGKITQLGDFLHGMKVKAAKEKIVEELRSLNLIKGAMPVKQMVKCAERSGAPLEIIPTYQWYVKVLENQKEIKQSASKCKWFPESMRIRLNNWIDGLNQDWCISRQRYFGVPFPVWYSKREGEVGKILVAEADQLPVDPLKDLPKGYTREEVVADTDVMDTWATSAVSPQLLTQTINDEFAGNLEKHKKLFPFDLRPQAHEIIRTWCFYTIVKAHYHAQQIPWHNVMISGWCLAADKSKMSKSKGNVVTPKALIENRGADIIRYWASSSKLGVDIVYSEEMFKIGKKLITKLWNASKFVSMHLTKLEEQPTSPKADVGKGNISETLDLWILSKLHHTIQEATASFKDFEYYEAKAVTENFFWNDFCDNYLELVKVRVYNSDNSNTLGARSALFTLYHCLTNLLKLFAPLMPHVTEELYQSIFEAKQSIHSRGFWPKIEDQFKQDDSLAQGASIVRILELVRKYKTENNLALNAKLTELMVQAPNEISNSALLDLKNATHVAEIKRLTKLEKFNLESECQEYAISVS